MYNRINVLKIAIYLPFPITAEENRNVNDIMTYSI